MVNVKMKKLIFVVIGVSVVNNDEPCEFHSTNVFGQGHDYNLFNFYGY